MVDNQQLTLQVKDCLYGLSSLNTPHLSNPMTEAHLMPLWAFCAEIDFLMLVKQIMTLVEYIHTEKKISSYHDTLIRY